MKIEDLRNIVDFSLCCSDVYRKNLVFNLWELMTLRFIDFKTSEPQNSEE